MPEHVSLEYKLTQLQEKRKKSVIYNLCAYTVTWQTIKWYHEEMLALWGAGASAFSPAGGRARESMLVWHSGLGERARLLPLLSVSTLSWSPSPSGSRTPGDEGERHSGREWLLLCIQAQKARWPWVTR